MKLFSSLVQVGRNRLTKKKKKIFSFSIKGSGLGRGVAKRFAAFGATLVLWDVNERGNEETKRQILEQYASTKVYAMTVNLCDRDDVYRVAQQVWILQTYLFFFYSFVFSSR